MSSYVDIAVKKKKKSFVSLSLRILARHSFDTSSAMTVGPLISVNPPQSSSKVSDNTFEYFHFLSPLSGELSVS